jgi:hypothetical protein
METTVTAASGDIQYDRLRRNTLIATPVALLVPVAFAALLVALGADLRWSAIGFGALGWIGALMLRAPLAAILSVVLGDPERVKPWIVGSSGPIEEGVRLLVLILVGRSFTEAAMIGVGWAAIEVVYTTMTGFITLSLVKRNDPEAVKAREMLQSQGMLRETGPALGVIERIGASALHIGFTLIVAWTPVWVVATALVHSAVNLSLIETFKKWPLGTELALLAGGLGAFIIGVAVLG